MTLLKEPLNDFPDEIVYVPWDSAATGISCYELNAAHEDLLALASRRSGHYSVRVDPRADKAGLHKYGFYYCDTLLQPYLTRGNFNEWANARVSLTRSTTAEALMDIYSGSFTYDRFHRDFNIGTMESDRRYLNWLQDYPSPGVLVGVKVDDVLVGGMAVTGGRLDLLALSNKQLRKIFQRGERGGGEQLAGLSRAAISSLFVEIFASGYEEIHGGVSAANMLVLNLGIDLGFRFRRPVDVYHLYVP